MSGDSATTSRAEKKSLLGDPRDWGYDDYNAVFFDLNPAVPTYHGFNDAPRQTDDDDVSEDVTRCGMRVSWYDRATGQYGEPGRWMPLRHAVKFGRPCGRCFKRSFANRTRRVSGAISAGGVSGG